MCEETARLCGAQVTSSTAKVSQCVHKYKFIINNHTSRHTTAHAFPWEEGAGNYNGYKGTFFQGVRLLLSLSFCLLWQSTGGERGLKMPQHTYIPEHRPYFQGQDTSSGAKSAHPLTSFPTSLPGTPCKVSVNSQAWTDLMPCVTALFLRNMLL